MRKKQIPWTAKDRERLVALYGKHPIGYLLRYFPGRTSMDIRGAAHRWGLKAKPTFEACKQDLIILHARGVSDMAIAKRLMVSRRMIQRWRERLDLPANFSPTNLPQEAKERIADKARERGIARRREAKRNRPRKKKTQESGLDRRIFNENEMEFIRAIDAFRIKNGRVPTLIEGFRIARELGWSKE